jgi:iron(III) transport system permease protein
LGAVESPIPPAVRPGGLAARLRPPRPALFGAVLAAGLALLPLAFIAIQVRDVGWSEARRLLWRPRVGELLVNTIELTVTVTVACAVLGLAAAWCVERLDIPFRRVFAVLLALPIAVPEYVNGMAWVSVVPDLHGFWAAVLVMTLSHYPLVYLPVAAVLRTGDPSLEEASRGLGRGPWRTFFRVTLPQLKLALLGGGLVIALHLLAEYGGFAVLRFRTFTTEIYSTYKLGFDPASASLLSMVLVVLCLLVLTGELGLRGRARHAGASAAGLRPWRRLRLSRWATALVVLGLLALAGLALGLPIGTLVYWLVQGSSTTLPDASIVGAALNTVFFGAAAAVIATALALPVAILAVRRRGFLGTVLERAAYVPRALPGLVVGLALVYFSIRYASAWYQSRWLLILAYTVLFLPLALVALQPTVARVSPSLIDAARSLGSRPLGVMRRVVLPLVAPGLAAAAALVFLTSVTELTATLLLRPTGTETLATQFWLYTSGLAYGAAAPYAALMVVISAVPTYLLVRRVDALAGGGVT